ncbi:MAG: enolase C-terminal domain-like protein [Spirochaetota bacterium]|nr:enolase C-terminal domain-like protein [Spirochaetota bacterium]
MNDLQIRLHFLSIPFKLTFTHSQAKRSDCDSIIVEVNDGTHRGFGEAILREYVNGPDAIVSDPGAAGDRMRAIFETFGGSSGAGGGRAAGSGGPSSPDGIGMQTLRKVLLNTPWKNGDLPLVSAAEAAVLDLLCKRENRDIYALLDIQPRRETLTYGGVLPILSKEAIRVMLERYMKHGIRYIRLKLSQSIDHNRSILPLVRTIVGEEFDVRVDVNCAWSVDDAVAHLDLLQENGIRLVEEPLGPDRAGMFELNKQAATRGISFVADESAVSFQDVDAIIGDGSFSMLNIRLAKNGGILRSLAIAEKAAAAGLRYQLGAHVGETGISSVTGRIAASLMSDPVYIDGSFDEYILADNITARSYSFGIGGEAKIIRNEGIGYEVDPEKLEKYSLSSHIIL